MAVLIRKYGLLDPIDWGEDCQQQLLLQNTLWNRLVRIERDAETRYHRILGADAGYARLIREIEHLDAEVARLWQTRRSMGHATPAQEVTAQIRKLISRRRRLAPTVRAMRVALRSRFAESLAAVDAERKAAVKRSRQESGLWWGNYNAVCNAYEHARARALVSGATLRFRSFDGTGRFRNQIIGGMSTDDLFAGRHSQVCAANLPGEAHTHPVRGERRRRSRTTLTATIYTVARERRTLTWPMIMHRPIPSEARIKEIIVTRKREGERFRWSAVFVCTQEDSQISMPPPTSAAAEIAFTCTEDGDSIRVATVSDGEGHVEHVRLPEAIAKRAAYIDGLRARAESRFGEMQARVTSWLATASFPSGLDTLARYAAQSWSPLPLSTLAIAWRARPDFRCDWRDVLESWRRTERREQSELANLRRKMLGQRRQHYQCEAKRFAERYGSITLTALDPGAPQKLRRLAAVSEFVEWLHKQCAKTGTHIETKTHSIDTFSARA